MLTDKKRLHQPTDTNSNPTHDGYRHIPGPEPFPPGSPEALDLAVELERLTKNQKRVETPGQTHFVPTPLNRDRKEVSGHTLDECPRATRRLIADEDSVIAVWLPCNARTCGYCRDAIDERDAARLAYSLRDSETIYLAEIPAHHWERTRKRAQRAGAVAVKMASATDHDRVIVVSSEPLTNQARPASMGEVVEAVQNRPTWAPGRVKTSGPGLVSVPEWDRMLTERDKGPHHEETPAETMAPGVTVELLTIAAAALKIPYRIEGAGSVRLASRWDDSRMVALRAWSKDPDGSLSWSRMLHEADTAQGVQPVEEVPLEVYDRQLSLEAIA